MVAFTGGACFIARHHHFHGAGGRTTDGARNVAAVSSSGPFRPHSEHRPGRFPAWLGNEGQYRSPSVKYGSRGGCEAEGSRGRCRRASSSLLATGVDGGGDEDMGDAAGENGAECRASTTIIMVMFCADFQKWFHVFLFF